MLHLPWNLQQASRRQRLAIPAVLLLIFFLAFSSQVLFCYIPPGPLLLRQAVCFNILIGCLLICYARACSADPGIIFSDPQTDYNTEPGLLVKWCEKCESKKPQRAHHCRVCKMCVWPCSIAILESTDDLLDASSKWITIVRGLPIAWATATSRIFCAFWRTLWWQCCIWHHFSTLACRIYGSSVRWLV